MYKYYLFKQQPQQQPGEKKTIQRGEKTLQMIIISLVGIFKCISCRLSQWRKNNRVALTFVVVICSLPPSSGGGGRGAIVSIVPTKSVCVQKLTMRPGMERRTVATACRDFLHFLLSLSPAGEQLGLKVTGINWKEQIAGRVEWSSSAEEDLCSRYYPK